MTSFFCIKPVAPLSLLLLFASVQLPAQNYETCIKSFREYQEAIALESLVQVAFTASALFSGVWYLKTLSNENLQNQSMEGKGNSKLEGEDTPLLQKKNGPSRTAKMIFICCLIANLLGDLSRTVIYWS